MSNFTIKAMKVLTDPSGIFSINPANEGGYNVLETPFTSSTKPFAKVAEVSTGPGQSTVNPLFLSMLDSGMSLDTIHTSEDTRLQGYAQFKALDGSDNIIPEAEVWALVVLWS